MSQAFKCDVCGTYHSGKPPVFVEFDTPLGPRVPEIHIDERPEADICGNCWPDMMNTFSLAPADQEDGNTDG